MTKQRKSPRRPFVAALLSLLGGPLGHLYSGRGVRFLVLTVLTLALLPVISAVAISLPESRFAYILVMFGVFCYPIFLVVDAYRVARAAPTSDLKWFQRWWLYPLVFIAYAIATDGVSKFTRAYVAEPFFIPAQSMAPAIIAGDRILVGKLMTNAESLAYDDVVVIRSEGPGSPLFVMRVLALGGDTIEIINDQIIRNGVKIADPHANHEGELVKFVDLTNMDALKVPDDCFFVLGDSRRRSNDSRLLGPIPNADFYGKALRVFWSRRRPFDEFGMPIESSVGEVAWERIGMAIR